jgi:16S rRNA A1518/A1519 N6-dimethyltransferase RsmA/KsgA/DIM1 with predicted DNA glycosylase/AP lyase activity
MDKNFLKFKQYNKSILDSTYKLINNIKPEEFYGDVLHVGLGTCYLHNQHTNNVTSTTIIEIDQQIIDFNQNLINENWNIIQHD